MTAAVHATARARLPAFLWGWNDVDRHHSLTRLAAAGLVATALLAVFGLPPVDLHAPLHLPRRDGPAVRDDPRRPTGGPWRPRRRGALQPRRTPGPLRRRPPPGPGRPRAPHRPLSRRVDPLDPHARHPGDARRGAALGPPASQRRPPDARMILSSPRSRHRRPYALCRHNNFVTRWPIGHRVVGPVSRSDHCRAVSRVVVIVVEGFESFVGRESGDGESCEGVGPPRAGSCVEDEPACCWRSIRTATRRCSGYSGSPWSGRHRRYRSRVPHRHRQRVRGQGGGRGPDPPQGRPHPRGRGVAGVSVPRGLASRTDALRAVLVPFAWLVFTLVGPAGPWGLAVAEPVAFGAAAR